MKLAESKMEVADFTQALATDPSQSVAMRERGLAYIKAGNLNKAHSDLTAYLAVQQDPSKRFSITI